MRPLPAAIRTTQFLISAGIIWTIAASCGAYWLVRYQMTPGELSAAGPIWPLGSVSRPAADRPTLLMFVHPQCSCSRASLGELEQLMQACKNRVAVRILFFKPADQPETWCHTDLWNQAQAIPGVEIQIDPEGRLARQFGAATSGQALIYNPKGRLVFSGGVTDGRGHFGDNPGLDAAIAAAERLDSTEQPVVTAEVFGCVIASQGPTASSASPKVSDKP